MWKSDLEQRFPSKLVFQFEDTVRLFGTSLLYEPMHFPKSKPYIKIESVCQVGAL